MFRRFVFVLLLLVFTVPASCVTADHVLSVTLFEDGADVVMNWEGAFDTDQLGTPTNTHTLPDKYVSDGAFRNIFAFGGIAVDSWIDPDLNNAFIPDFMTTDGIRNADQLIGFRWGILDHDFGGINNGELYIQNGYVSGTRVSGQMVWLNTSFDTLGFFETSGTFTYGDNDSIVINVARNAVPEPSSTFILGIAMASLICRRLRTDHGA